MHQLITLWGTNVMWWHSDSQKNSLECSSKSLLCASIIHIQELSDYISPVNIQHRELCFLSCCSTSRLSVSTLEWDYEHLPVVFSVPIIVVPKTFSFLRPCLSMSFHLSLSDSRGVKQAWNEHKIECNMLKKSHLAQCAYSFLKINPSIYPSIHNL